MKRMSNYDDKTVLYFERGPSYMMKSTGIVRKVDELGRVVIPIELRRTLGIGEKDALEIYVDGERIMLKKYEPACIFCGNAENVTYFKGKIVCNVCLSDMPTPVTK
jgi:transcriptional pleiotropic regulator of transition state genes